MSLANLMKRGSLRALATATLATPATDEPETTSPVATVATVAVAEAPKAERDMSLASVAAEILDPDRWCWPYSDAMNGAELETMARRVAVFHRRGIRLDEAETLADSLVKRDRDLDNRRLCLECGALRPGLVCSVPTKAGAGRTVSGLVKMPQHCPGFSPVEGL